MSSIAICLSAACASSADIGYQFVTVGNAGNAGETFQAHGAVPYVYKIGKFHVTLAEYTFFLNAVAKTDPYQLYVTSLATNLNIAGIARTGTSGNYSYSVIGDGLRPVTYISWLDAARFANWMHNGQPSAAQGPGVTETGAYTLNGDMTAGTQKRNPHALYWLPSYNEFYKAAYYDPNKGGAGIAGYWSYATKSNTSPGNIVGGGINQANWLKHDGTNFLYCLTQSSSYSTTQNYLTPVGAFVNSPSAYGTFDQNGNVSQWTDHLGITTSREFLGGSWGVSGGSKGSRAITTGTFGDQYKGLRIATTFAQDGDTDGLLDAWEAFYWPADNGHAASGDFDHDGLNELLELAFGLNPTIPDSALAPTPIAEAGYLTVTLTKLAGVVYEVQSSGTLPNGLFDSFSATSTTVLTDTSTTLKVRDNVLIGTSPYRFMRIKVTAVP